jgi:hypothetical protein
MRFNQWLEFWFQPAPPTNLAVSRALFFAGLFVLYAHEDFTAWSAVDPGFWMPLPAFAALSLSPLSAAALAILQAVWRVALVSSAVGFFTRTSMWTAAVLGFYLLGLPHNFGHVYHFDALLVITAFVLACSRAGDAWSIDALLNNDDRPVLPSGEYTWPIRMVWVSMSLVFAAAGIAKLRYGGLAWITSDHMSIVLMRAPYHVSDADPITHAGVWIASRPWLSHAVASAALVVELGFALALISRAARLILVPSAFLMLVGIRILMGPTFGGFLIANVFWVPWSAVGTRLASWIRPAQRLTPIFESGSDVGSNTVATLRHLDLLGIVTPLEADRHRSRSCATDLDESPATEMNTTRPAS